MVVVVAPGPADRLLGGTVSTLARRRGDPGRLALVAHPRGHAWRMTRPVRSSRRSRARSPCTSSTAPVGHRGLRVVEVTPARRGAGAARTSVASLVDGRRTALVVVGSGSGRHGPDAPLADDDRAPAYDAALLADLADAGPGRAGAAGVVGPRASPPSSRCAAGRRGRSCSAPSGDLPVDARLLADEVVLGAQHAVLVWTVAG